MTSKSPFPFRVLLPGILIFVFLPLTGYLLGYAQKCMLILAPPSPGNVVGDNLLLPISCAILIALVVLARKYSFKTVFSLCLGVVLLACLTFGILLYACPSQFHSEYLVFAVSIVNSIWNPLLWVLCWGFLNDKTPYSRAKNYYAFFAVYPVIAFVLSQLFYKQMCFLGDIGGSLLAVFYYILAFIGVLLVATWIIMALSYRKEEIVEESPELNPMTLGIFCSLGLMVLAAFLLPQILVASWESLIAEMFPVASARAGFMREHYNVVYQVNLFLMVGIFVVPLLLRWWEWKWVAFIVPFILFVLGLGFFALSMGLEIGADPKASALSWGSAFMIFNIGTIAVLVLAPKQMVLTCIARKSRFATLIAVEFIFLWIGQLLLPLIEAKDPYNGLYFAIVGLVWLFAVSSLGKRIVKH